MSTPTVLLVCVRNSGKSQMAAALMRQAAGERIEVHSAGTDPGAALNPLSLQVLDEVGAPTAGEVPKPIDAALLARTDLVVVLGREARPHVPGECGCSTGTPWSLRSGVSRASSACA